MNENRKIVPAVALRGMTIFPDMIIHFDLSRSKSIQAIEQAMVGDQYILLVAQKETEENEPNFDDVYHVGCLALIKQVIKLPNDIIRVLVEGSKRARLLEFTDNEKYLSAVYEEMVIEETELSEAESEAMLRQIKDLFLTYYKYNPKNGKALSQHLEDIVKLPYLLDQIMMNLSFSYTDKQQLLEAATIRERYEILSKILANEVEISKIRLDLTEKIREKVEKNQRDYLLREQLNYIRQELGEDNTFSEADQFETELKKLKASKEVKDKIKKEISRFKSVSGSSSESAVIRGYIETLLDLPWDKVSKDKTNITRAEQILDKDHYGLEKVKERMLEFLAVRSLTKKGESPIICLVGPPGTGKTSIAKSVAQALNKEYIRICLGGVRDEAEIRGHRKTYVGAMPGRIAVGLKSAGVKNPLILLDEIDKLSRDYKGDTASALLEVLDSEQNHKFRDHYVEIPMDLSEVLFIATANSVTTIPRPLLDRMELIEVTSYTSNEKFHIAREHLVKKQILKNGLTPEQISFSDGALNKMILSYTKESGVRELERKLGEICRKTAREILQEGKKVVKITSSNLEKYLGKEKYAYDPANEEDAIGIVRGLAWTSVGGDTLQIEVNIMPGKGDIELTGQMGNVMKESAKTAISYIRSISSEYHIATDFFKKKDFHIHIPEGAIPKDGPSAGITMATALLSAVTDTPVKSNVAMTGEVTLRGRVLPIGGLKEKILAAKVAGIHTVLVPKKNQKDIEEISKEIKTGIDIIYVESMQEVITRAFA